MNKIRFSMERNITSPASDAAIISDGEDPVEALAEAMVGTASTSLFFTAGGVRLHLAAWQSPDHWSDEWAEAGVEDPYGFIDALVASDE